MVIYCSKFFKIILFWHSNLFENFSSEKNWKIYWAQTRQGQANKNNIFTWIWLLITVWPSRWCTVTSFNLQCISSLLLSIEHNFGKNFSALKIYFKEIFSLIARWIHNVIINLVERKCEDFVKGYLFELLSQSCPLQAINRFWINQLKRLQKHGHKHHFGKQLIIEVRSNE